jgi:hypothetical protein
LSTNPADIVSVGAVEEKYRSDLGSYGSTASVRQLCKRQNRDYGCTFHYMPCYVSPHVPVTPLVTLVTRDDLFLRSLQCDWLADLKRVQAGVTGTMQTTTQHHRSSMLSGSLRRVAGGLCKTLVRNRSSAVPMAAAAETKLRTLEVGNDVVACCR